MRKLLAVLAICLLPLAGFLAYSPDVPAMVSLGRTSSMGVGGIANSPYKDLADTAGIKWARHGVYWYKVQEDSADLANGTYDWSVYDNEFANLNNRTYPFEIMPVFTGTPGAAQDPDCPTYPDPHCPPAPEYMDEWRDFIAEFADRYTYIDHYEVWNEAFKEDWGSFSVIDGDTLYPARAHFTGTPSQLAEMTDSVAVAINSEDKVIGWGTIGETGSNGSTTAEVLDLTDNSVDIVSGHCYASGSKCVSRYQERRDTLSAKGYSSMDIWSTEGYHPASPRGYYPDTTSTPPWHPTDEENRTYISELTSLASSTSWFDKVFLFRWSLTPPEWHEHPDLPADSQWHTHGYNYLVVQQETDGTLLGVREKSYCFLVSLAGNEGQEDRCPDVSGISGHDMNQTVPPNSTCTHTATGETGGDTPYYYYWYVDGDLQKDSSEDYLAYSTPSSGSYTVKVVLEDDNGAQDEYSETMTVDSNAMCP